MIEMINSQDAPKAVGPYSHAVVHHHTAYLSGQIGIDPATGALVGDDVAAQAKQVMVNLQAVLAAVGSGRSKIIKVSIYLINMDDFSDVNALYAEWLQDHRPARATVAVASLPLNAKIEMDVIASVSSA
ncbi:MAG: Rid family detoxifying hydrolase [Mariprofundales bacterium]